MAEQIILNTDLYDNLLTERKGDYTAKPRITGTLYNTDIAARIVIAREHLLIADEGHVQPRCLDAAGRQKAREAVRAVQDLFYVAKLRALVKKHLHRVIPPVGSERFLL